VAAVVRPGSGAGRRWAVVAGLVAALVALPPLIGALPASDADVTAADLRSAVLASDAVGYSGYAVSAGGLSLPVTDQLTSVADLFSDRTTMRVWWRGPADNRVDVVTAAGETGTHRDPAGTWTWDYETATATRSALSPLGLPAPPDLLPSALGRRLLSETADDELSRIGARRVAGREGLGLRLTPADAASSVSRVDVWVDGDSGLPLQVEVYGKGTRLPALDTRFLDLDLAVPAADVTRFRPPPAAAVRQGQDATVVLEAGRRIRPVALPPELAGLTRRQLAGVPAGIGLYGRGVTLLAVAPVPPRLANGLRQALDSSPGAVVDSLGTRVSAGPVALMLVQPPGQGPYLLTGTVTLDALAAAAAQLPDLEGSR
jgi:outer membrane lipoprotein-sorting protein